MKFSLAALFAALAVSVVSAQDPFGRETNSNRDTDPFGQTRVASSSTARANLRQSTISRGELAPTPEMWFYEQAMSHYNDPRTAVRAKAEYRADQRQRRLAARKWFGYSNARPVVSVTSMGGMVSPGWRSNTSFDPLRFSARRNSLTVVESDRASIPTRPLP